MCCLYSEYWLQWAIEYFRNKNYSFPSDQTEKMLMNKSRCVGFPELDQCRLSDPEEVRKRWGIPKDQPVVVLLPFPTWTAPYSFWSHYIYSQSSTYLQLYHILRTARIKYVKHVLKGWNDFAVVRAVKEFCKRNGAFLLVKSRLKDPIPPYMEAVADKCIYDERHYPATILETLSIAHLCINFYSTAFTEVIGIGIPNLCIEYSAEDTDYDPLLYTMMINHQEGGFYQYRGVSTCMSIPEVIETLPGKSLSGFKMDSHERKAYVEKFLGYDDGQSSKRVLDEIQALVAKGKSQT